MKSLLLLKYLRTSETKLQAVLRTQTQGSYHRLTQTLIQALEKLEKLENITPRGSIQRFLFTKINEDWLNFCLNMC